jgi:cytochrome c oxidase subunit III
MPSTAYTSGTVALETVSENKSHTAALDTRFRARTSATLASKAQPSETGVWVGIAAVFMSFSALTSAMIVREGSAPDWRHFHLPLILYLNTLILLASSLTLELSRRRIARDVCPSAVSASGADQGGPRVGLREHGPFWLRLTLALGLIFVAGQYLAWRNLRAQGFFLATSPSSSFFYLLTALHGLHLLGGVAGLVYVLRRLSRVCGPAARSALGAASLYWHFVDGLWVYLLLILALRM